MFSFSYVFVFQDCFDPVVVILVWLWLPFSFAQVLLCLSLFCNASVIMKFAWALPFCYHGTCLCVWYSLMEYLRLELGELCS